MSELLTAREARMACCWQGGAAPWLLLTGYSISLSISNLQRPLQSSPALCCCAPHRCFCPRSTYASFVPRLLMSSGACMIPHPAKVGGWGLLAVKLLLQHLLG